MLLQRKGVRPSLLWLGFAVLLLSMVARITPAQSPDSGSLRGQLRNDTTGKVLANYPVTLELHAGSGEHTPLNTTTDDEGKFEFNELSLDPQVHYQLQVRYGGRTYTRDFLQFTRGDPVLVLTLNVYDADMDPSQLRIAEHQVWFAQVPQMPAAAQVLEFISIQNGGQSAYLDENGFGALIPLPQGHQHVQSLDPELADELVVQDDMVAYRRPILPGTTVLAFSYITLAQPMADLSRPAALPTQTFFLMVSGSGLAPQESDFLAGNPQQAEGVTYQTYVRQNIGAGEMIQAHLSASGSGSTGGSNGRLILWGVIALVAAAIFFGIVKLTGRRTLPTESAPHPAQQHPVQRRTAPSAPARSVDAEQLRDARLELIAHLDDMLESKQISEDVHRQLREEQKQALAALMQQLQQ